MQPWSSRPLSEVIRNVTTAVVEGQIESDRDAIELQREIERAVERGDLDHELDVPWYRFSEIDFELDLALELAGREIRDEDGKVRAYQPVVNATPSDSRRGEFSDGDPERANTIRTKLVPVQRARVKSDE